MTIKPLLSKVTKISTGNINSPMKFFSSDPLNKRVKIDYTFDFFFKLTDKGMLLFSASGNLLKLNSLALSMLSSSKSTIAPDLNSFKSWVTDNFELSNVASTLNFNSILNETCIWKRLSNTCGEIKWLKSSPKKFLDSEMMFVITLEDITDEIDDERISYGILTLASHKLRTPMNHICGGLELMGTVDEHTPYEEWSEYMNYINQGVKRLQKDLFSLFQFMDMKRSGIHSNTTRYFCNKEVVEKTIHNISRNLKLNKVDIDLSNLSSTVLSEETLQIVINEILTNSKKFHPKHNPSVDVCFKNIVKDGKQHELWTFTDNGTCINHSKLKSIFKPFQQSSKLAHTGEVPGFGIGLNIISMQINLYGGRLWLENRNDIDGVVVNFTVPITTSCQ